MDFNDIQNVWDNEKTENVVLPSNLEKIQSANTPLGKIRKNLKKEFVYQVIFIVLIGFIPYFYDYPENWIIPFYLFFSVLVAVCLYYSIKLYLFYKRLNVVSLKTKDNLYETYFDVRLNMELYKTFGFALTPLMVLFLIGFIYYQFSLKANFQITDFSNFQLLSAFAIIIFYILLTGLTLEWWVQYFYGKYAAEIKKVIDELREE